MTTVPQTENVNTRALAWTVGVHILLLLLFFLWKYTVPVVVQQPEMGMEVNLGTSDNGSGTDQPMSVEDPSADQPTVTYRHAAHASSAAKDILQSNDADAPTINAANATKDNNRSNLQEDKNRHKANDEQANDNHTHRQEHARYVFAGGTGKGGNSAAQTMSGTSEGIGTGPGDMGVPGGTPGATNYKGSPGNGTGGISHTLGGRNIVAYPSRDASFREGGTVVIRVTVNRNGDIVSKQIISASSAELRSLAMQKVAHVRFNKSDSAPEEQFGNITFVFKTRS